MSCHFLCKYIKITHTRNYLIINPICQRVKVPSYYNVPIKLYSICTELNYWKIISLNTDVKEKVNKMAEKMAAASGG